MTVNRTILPVQLTKGSSYISSPIQIVIALSEQFRSTIPINSVKLSVHFPTIFRETGKTASSDVSLIERKFLPKAVAGRVPAEEKRCIEKQLASLGFYNLRYNYPPDVAVIPFGKNSERSLHGSYVQSLRFRGKDRAGDINNKHKFSGNLYKKPAKIDTFIENSIS